MHPDLRKIGTVASTEFGSAVQTKAFLVSLLLLPVIIGGSMVLQITIARRVDTKPRSVAVIDRTGELYSSIERAARAHNAQTDDPQGNAVHPRIELSPMTNSGGDDAATLLELSDRIRGGELDAFVVIPPETIRLPPPSAAPPLGPDYHSDSPNDDVARNWLAATIDHEVRSRRFRSAGIDQALADRLSQPIILGNLGLFELDRSAPGPRPVIKPAQKVDPVRTAAVPAVLMFVLLLLVMTTTPHLLNSVIEEKMSKISEVLLGSLTPFELMMGKLLGNAGIVLLLALLYLSAGYAAAAYYGYADMLSTGLLLALGLFLILATLLFGSLYMAVGAACNEIKDAQSLMMPIMLLSMFPAFVWMAVLRNPSSGLAVGLSLFPPASPFLMLMRIALRPAPPAWQVALAVVLTSLTTLFCVWAAAKILRTGLLMQGKAPSYAELARWVFAK
jgi:ABC-type Na+ efflux pump permease subunit